MNLRVTLFAFCCCLPWLPVHGQNRAASLAWPASWICSTEPYAADLQSYHFRKTFDLENKPEAFRVRVTADQRFRLYVNGVFVASGPQRGDRWAWRYDTIDLAPHLRVGRNVLAADVWRHDAEGPAAMPSLTVGLMVQAESEAAAVVNTNSSWKVANNKSRSALSTDYTRVWVATGPGERVDARRHLWGWNLPEFDDSAWGKPWEVRRAMPPGVSNEVWWALVPRSIPPMFETREAFESARWVRGLQAAAGWQPGKGTLTIPANFRVEVLLDRGVETNAYPHVVVSGGRDARIRMVYAEALFDQNGDKGNRNEVEGKTIVGVEDEFILDGAEHRDFSPLYFRTFRYVGVTIETAAEPVRVDDVYPVATGYPFQERARFVSSDPGLSDVWTVGWRTALLCAYETYMDCPYYEQLQYVGDTRIQALISLYVSGDDRLMRNALELFDLSRVPIGLTQSRYPSTTPQIIPTFSLFWVDMVHDYWMHRTDDAFVKERLFGIGGVLTWFEKHVDPSTGMLGRLPYWCFVDWAPGWEWQDESLPNGHPKGVHEGGSAVITLQLAGTLDHAADLHAALGDPGLATRYRELASRLKRSTIERCWDAGRGLLADTPAKTEFSQHANALAVLTGAVEGDEAAALMRRTLVGNSITPCTLYFRFYLLRAMKKAGLGEQYVAQLQPWRDMLKLGLSTFAERPEPSRSDCHAWSASPCYELLATVCGIEPASPGFKSVRISPNLGELTFAEGAMPHPAGMISTAYRKTGGTLRASVTLPEGVTGEFVWKGERIPLAPGATTLDLPL